MKTRTFAAVLAVSGILGFAAGAEAAGLPVRGWSAIADVPADEMQRVAQSLPLSEMAVSDQPYCASDAEIAATLTHDFEEALIHRTTHGGLDTQLWGSGQMGTWTLVTARGDGTSCIFASGIGFNEGEIAERFYNVAGLR